MMGLWWSESVGGERREGEGEEGKGEREGGRGGKGKGGRRGSREGARRSRVGSVKSVIEEVSR